MEIYQNVSTRSPKKKSKKLSLTQALHDEEDDQQTQDLFENFKPLLAKSQPKKVITGPTYRQIAAFPNHFSPLVNFVAEVKVDLSKESKIQEIKEFIEKRTDSLFTHFVNKSHFEPLDNTMKEKFYKTFTQSKEEIDECQTVEVLLDVFQKANLLKKAFYLVGKQFIMYFFFEKPECSAFLEEIEVEQGVAIFDETGKMQEMLTNFRIEFMIKQRILSLDEQIKKQKKKGSASLENKQLLLAFNGHCQMFKNVIINFMKNFSYKIVADFPFLNARINYSDKRVKVTKTDDFFFVKVFLSGLLFNTLVEETAEIVKEKGISGKIHITFINDNHLFLMNDSLKSEVKTIYFRNGEFLLDEKDSVPVENN